MYNLYRSNRPKSSIHTNYTFVRTLDMIDNVPPVLASRQLGTWYWSLGQLHDVTEETIHFTQLYLSQTHKITGILASKSSFLLRRWVWEEGSLLLGQNEPINYMFINPKNCLQILNNKISHTFQWRRCDPQNFSALPCITGHLFLRREP